MGNGKKRPEVPVRKAPPRSKLDPRLAIVLSMTAEELQQSEKLDQEAIKQKLKALKERVEKSDGKDPLLKKDDSPSAIEGISRITRARFLHYSRLTHGITFKPRPEASVFIKFRGDPDRFAEYGITVKSVAGDIATATVPLSAIPRLEADPDVIFVELSRPLYPELDESVPITEADVYHAAVPPVDGEGVIVGIVDYGMDFYHPDLRDPTTGDTRVLWLWDQRPLAGSTAGAVPAPWNYGREFSADDIDDDIQSGTPYSVVNHRAGNGSHGTHVTGIIAGNGEGDGIHIGMAPRADIIFVDTIGSGVLALGDMVEFAEGVDYVFARAGAVPCVVNMSLGDNLGPHDGTSLVEQFIDNLLAVPGRAATIAAGNANNAGKHATGTVAPGGSDTPQITVPNNQWAGESLEIWYDGHDRLDLTITPPGMAALPVVTPGSGTVVMMAGAARVTVTSVVNDPRNGDNVIEVLLQAVTGPIPGGQWTLELSGNSGGSPSVINGRWHGWIDRNTGVRWTTPTADTMTLTTPCTGIRSIAVASHAKPGGQVLAASSGRGPTRDGRMKPDIAAPGVNIVAARSRDMTLDNPGALYRTGSGTSMAAPHVCGAIALMFQCRGGLMSSADAKYILKRLADTTGIATVPDLGFGWGRMRIGNACAWAMDGPDVWIRTNHTDTGIEPYTGSGSWMSPDIWVRPMRDGGTTHENPEYGQENHVHVTVRNRGTGPAFNTRVYLYWADPATNIPFSAWQKDGIRVGTADNNMQVIPELGPGAAVQTPVPFSWFPPAPHSSLHGDSHFCLLGLLENENDPSGVGAGGWQCVRNHNNIALKNVHIVDLLPDETTADDAFYLRAGNGTNSFMIDGRQLPDTATVTARIPVYAVDLLRLPDLKPEVRDVLRDLEAVNDLKTLVRMPELSLRLRELRLPETRAGAAGIQGATVHLTGDSIDVRLVDKVALIERIQLSAGAMIPIRIQVSGLTGGPGTEYPVHVEQWVDGNPVGGVTVIFRKQKKKLPRIKLDLPVSPALELIRRGRIR